MREIKFRAWHKADVKMYDVYGFSTNQWFLRGKTFPMPKGAIILMQYTGLKDKNGKEIYEGDLLRNPPTKDWEKNNFVAFEVFFHDNDCANGNVGWQFNRLHFQGNICGYHMHEKFLPRYTKQMEVIGNIYEHPHLLEDNS